MHEEYGEKQGDRIFYSKENGDKKFKRTITGKKSKWWAERIAKLPEARKSAMIIVLDMDQGVDWWLRRIDTMRASKPRPVDKLFGEQPNIAREEAETHQE